jgi:LuxR family maltose regulon positive regulatory protein
MAPARIAAAKLRIPLPRQTLVPRRQLLERVRQGRGRRLTLLSAPAGYGKTTLLSQWAKEDAPRTPFAWISLDGSDADPVRLWAHVIRGLHGTHPAVGKESLQVLRGGPSAIVSHVIPALADELDGAPALVLVLDDWHACASPANDEALDLLVARAPPAVQVTVSTRSDPRLPLARLRAHDDLVDVRADHLRLTDAEAAELFVRAEIELDPLDAARLNGRTEGWVTGLHLASILALEHQDRSAFVASFSGESRSILDYLAIDVLAILPLEQRDFLLQTSVLDRLSGPLCDAVLGRTGSASMLDELERANVFVVRLEGHDAYRYHPLFSTMLRNELELQEPELIATLHLRASRWLEEHGDHEAAVEHAIAGGDAALASDLVMGQFRPLTNGGRVATLGRWLEQLSWPEALAEPQLAVTRAAIAAQTGRPADVVERWLEIAAAGTRTVPMANGTASLDSGIAIVRSVYLTQGPEVAAEAARRSIEAEHPRSGWRRQALLGLGQALYLLGEPEAARPWLEDARRLPGARDHTAASANVLAYLAFCELDRSEVDAAERLARAAIALLDEQHLTGGHTGASSPRTALGAALTARGRSREAIGQLELAVDLAAPAAPSYWHGHALLHLAVARHTIGDVRGAEAALDAAQADLDSLPVAPLLADLAAHVRMRVRSRPHRAVSAGEELSEREVHVLRLLATDLSLRELAGQLYVSLNTVKTHTRAIYRKLDATSRRDAVERAMLLGLLDDSPE